MSDTVQTYLRQIWPIGQHGNLSITVDLDVPMPSNGWTIFSRLPGRVDQVVADLAKFLDKSDD